MHPIVFRSTPTPPPASCYTCQHGGVIFPAELEELGRGTCPHCGTTLPAGYGIFVVVLRPPETRSPAAA